MADTKISALTAATTPLAGTEVLPIVQSGVTKQVSVANLTAGRAVSMASATITAGLVVDTTTLVVDAVNNAVGFGTATPQEAVDIYGASAGVLRLSTPNRSYNIFANNSNGYLYIRDVTGSSNRVYIDTSGNVTFADGNLIQGTANKGINFTANTNASGMTSKLLNWYEEGTWTPTSFDITYSSASGSYIRIGSQVFVYFNIVLPTTTDANNITINGFPFTVANLDQMRAGSIGYTNYATACAPTAVKNTTRGNIVTFGGTPVTNVAASAKTFSGVFIYSV